MKIRRNYDFVLIKVNTVEELNDVKKHQILFTSECHYYCEKSLISDVKDCEKTGDLTKFNGIYAVLKVEKPKCETTLTVDEDGNEVSMTVKKRGKSLIVEVLKLVKTDEGYELQIQ